MFRDFPIRMIVGLAGLAVLSRAGNSVYVARGNLE